MKAKTLFFVESDDAASEIWQGVPTQLPEAVVSLWLPTEAEQQAVADEGSDRYEECNDLSTVLGKLRAGEDADACWDNSLEGGYCGFEWREE